LEHAKAIDAIQGVRMTSQHVTGLHNNWYRLSVVSPFWKLLMTSRVLMIMIFFRQFEIWNLLGAWWCGVEGLLQWRQ
jgi:hypothetical protein